MSNDDETVPPDESRQVYASTTHPDGLVVLDGRSHGEVEIHAGDEAIAPISGAISRWTGCLRT
jgi:hypothetical protein